MSDVWTRHIASTATEALNEAVGDVAALAQTDNGKTQLRVLAASLILARMRLGNIFREVGIPSVEFIDGDCGSPARIGAR